MFFRILLFPLVVGLLVFCTGASMARTGIVLLHGKVGSGSLLSLPAKLRAAGFLVETPAMQWNRYTRGYEASLELIDKAAERLRKNGATRVVVGGHSMGANAALGYAARRKGLAGVMAIAAGHRPDASGFQRKAKFDYKRAEDLIRRGNGAVKTSFRDVNQGRISTVTTTPEIYLSWFHPSGPASMPKNATGIPKGTPLFWIAGQGDSITKLGKSYVYARAPAHPMNRYVVVGGGHKETPAMGAKAICGWLVEITPSADRNGLNCKTSVGSPAAYSQRKSQGAKGKLCKAGDIAACRRACKRGKAVACQRLRELGG